MKRIDQIAQGGYPIDDQSLNYIQTIVDDVLNASANIMGSQIAINLVNDGVGNISAGHIVYNGEVLNFSAGALATKVAIIEERTNRIYLDGQSKASWLNRYAKFGNINTPNAVAEFNYADLKHIDSLEGLFDKLVLATNAEVADDNNDSKLFSIKTLLTRIASLTVRALVRAATTAEITSGTKDDVFISPKQAKDSGLMPLIKGNYNIGDTGAADQLRTISFPSVGTSNYMVLGSIVGVSADFNLDDDVIWSVREKTATSFKLALRETANETQNISFNYMLIAF